MNLTEWSWLFLALYIALMVGIGFYAQRKIKHADDFATARGAYGPLFIAIACSASTTQRSNGRFTTRRSRQATTHRAARRRQHPAPQLGTE